MDMVIDGPKVNMRGLVTRGKLQNEMLVKFIVKKQVRHQF